MEDRDLTWRDLSRLTEDDSGDGYHHSYLYQVGVGDEAVTMPVVEAIAKGLRIEPEAFAEYRMMQLQRDLGNPKPSVRAIEDRTWFDAAVKILNSMTVADLEKAASAEPGDPAETFGADFHEDVESKYPERS